MVEVEDDVMIVIHNEHHEMVEQDEVEKVHCDILPHNQVRIDSDEGEDDTMNMPHVLDDYDEVVFVLLVTQLHLESSLHEGQ